MICASTFKNGKPCHYKAKQAIQFEDTHFFVCNRHTLDEANRILGGTFSTIEELANVDEVSDINKFKHSIRANDWDAGSDAMLLIKATTDFDIERDGTSTTDSNRVEYHPVKIGDEKLTLMICKKDELREDLYEAMCVQVGSKSCDVFLPIKSFESVDRHCYVSKMVRPKHDDDGSQNSPYFYQLNPRSKLLREGQFDKEALSVFAIRMCALIQNLHSSRMCSGDHNYQSIAFTDITDPKTAYIKTAKYITFWIDSHGEFKSEERKIPGTKVPLTAARRVHTKKAPGRYDDFESLLYLILTLKGKILPWNGTTAIRETNQLKESFLKDSLGIMNDAEGSQSLKCVADMILFAEYEERPNYIRITKLLSEIAMSD